MRKIKKKLSIFHSSFQSHSPTKSYLIMPKVYQEVLNKSGYTTATSHKETNNLRPQTWRKRHHMVQVTIQKDVEINIRKCPVSHRNQHFPKSKSLQKIFNQNTSYSCKGNVKTTKSNRHKAEKDKSKFNSSKEGDCNCQKSNR